MKTIKTVFCIGLLFIIHACGSKENNTEKSEEAVKTTDIVELCGSQISNAKILIGEIKQKKISSIIRVNGQIDVPPQNLSSICVPLGGYLRSTKLLPGMHVKKGEVIAVLEDQAYIQLQQEYLMAKSRLALLDAEYQRQEQLIESKASSEKTFLNAKNEFEMVKISLASLAEKLGMININYSTLTEKNISRSINLYAPFNGFVTKVNVNIGKYLQPTDVLFEIVNPEDIHLNLTVFEKDLSQLEISQKLIAYTNTHPDKKYNCEILLVSKDISKDGSAEVHCHFEEYDKSLIPGMYMNAEIDCSSRLANVVTEDAVITYEGKEYLFFEVEKNKYKMSEIKSGVRERGLVEIINGESLIRKKIVTNGAYTLLMALKNVAE